MCLLSLIGSSNEQQGERETRRGGVHGRFNYVNGSSTDGSRDRYEVTKVGRRSIE